MGRESTIAVARSAASQAGLTGAPYDVERIRADFPILFREVNDKPLVYLDNGASAQKPASVMLGTYLVNQFVVDVHHWS